MRFEELLAVVGDEPVFETGLLLAGDVDPADVRRQLCRWVSSGRLLQLRRGVYALAEPYAKARPHPFLVANRLVAGSYVSRQSALAFHGLIPETVSLVTSVATSRPVRLDTPLGRFDFRHIKRALHFGYERLDVGAGQVAIVARPEKALLDLVHLQAGGDGLEYLVHLRLQHLDRLNPELLLRLGERTDSPRLRRAARRIVRLVRLEAEEYETL